MSNELSAISLPPGGFGSPVLPCYSSDLPSARQTRAAARPGRLPERPMGADCKSVGVFLRRFESCTCHANILVPVDGEAFGLSAARRCRDAFVHWPDCANDAG